MGSVAKNLALWIAYLRRCAARCWWPMESKDCDQSKKRMVNGMGEALLDHTGVHFKNGVSKRNWAITGWRSVLLIACINHNNFAEFPVVWGCAQKEAIIIMREEVSLDWMWEES